MDEIFQEGGNDDWSDEEELRPESFIKPYANDSSNNIIDENIQEQIIDSSGQEPNNYQTYRDFIKDLGRTDLLVPESYTEEDKFLINKEKICLVIPTSIDLDEENPYMTEAKELCTNFDEILEQEKELGKVLVVDTLDNRKIYFCFTRVHYFDSNTYWDIFSTLQDLKQKAEENGENALLIPNFKNNFDSLRFAKIKSMIHYVFRNSKIKLTIRHNKLITPELRQIPTILKEFHDSSAAGHPGIKKTLSKIKSKYSWDGMRQDIVKYVKACTQCQRNKRSNKNSKAPMEITTTSADAFDRIAFDIVGPLPYTSRENKYILTLQDDLTKFSLAYPLDSISARTVAEKMVTFYAHHGIPKTILTDLGTQFTSKLIENLSKLLKIKHLKTTAYHPQTNGALERSHSTLKDFLTHYVDKDQTDWDVYLPLAMFSYNTSEHSTTGFTPYELLYGKKPNLPSSIQNPDPLLTYEDYINQVKYKLATIRALAKERILKAKENSKRLYDRNAEEPKYKINDFVYLKDNLPRSTSKKLTPKWLGPYQITKLHNNQNITIKIGNKEKRVHVNLVKHHFTFQDANN
jgi:transposase InsO family protein